jgi:membrane fusion protein, heavy metal efflux system
MPTLPRRPLGARRLGKLVLLAAMLAALGAMPSALAGGGDDHSHGPAEHETVTAAAARTRLSVQSESHELVAIRTGPETMTLYLDRYADNAPVTDAAIEATLGDETLRAVPQPDGTFLLRSPRLLAPPGSIEVVFAVTGPGGDDLLIGEWPAEPAAVAAVTGHFHVHDGLIDELMHRPYLALGGVFGLGLLLGVLLRASGGRPGRRRRRRRVPQEVLAASLAAGLALAPMPALAGGGDDHSHGPATPVAAGVPRATVDTPRRLPDGTVFLPKPSQRLLEIRTTLADPETAHRTITLVGRVVTDPNRGGLAQSAIGGRVVPPEGGLPRLGQAVRRGEVLALVEPPLPAADRTTIAERSGEIDQLIAAAEARLQRARSLAATGAGTRVQVVDTEIELEGLRRRRAMVRENRVAAEELRAPSDGVIASARVVAGQVVQAQDVLFQVVDPEGLWVEALAHGADAAALDIQGATASAAGGPPMRLALQGFGRTLQQQATLVQFAILDPPPGLSVGQPVTVSAQLGQPVEGIVVPRSALVRGGNGEALVWRHAAPEVFEPTPVRADPLDGARVLLAAGLPAGARVVVRGADLINQVR